MEQSTESEARFLLLVQLLRVRVCATAQLNLSYLLFSLTGTTSELIQLTDLAENDV